eukprot:CAMPEP_0184314232 /NCGR_PEP_ID=MMETSP1049-20130417/72591_1 /TAXON_ID=77928 /ORGANISM="Proteomonas sulcata, Strain CCMP704" /LENGTH=106 /DNA_ID=CAMNT_0026632045 /DNA_START=50 /DNA_END=370 /DNA_ORIENTATION=+
MPARPQKPGEGAAQYVPNQRVDIRDLSWEDKERVLRLLFAKINQSQMAVQPQGGGQKKEDEGYPDLQEFGGSGDEAPQGRRGSFKGNWPPQPVGAANPFMTQPDMA